MQIYGEGVHDDDLRRNCPHQFRGLLGQQTVIGHPWIARMKMPFDAQPGGIDPGVPA